MRALDSSVSKKLLFSVGELYTHHDLESFVPRALEIVGAAIPSDYTLCSEMNLRRKRVATRSHPGVDLALSPEAQACYFREHPFVQHHLRTGDVSATRLSDFIPRGRYREMALYKEVFRALGIEYQLGCSLRPPSPRFTFGLALVRTGRDFSIEEQLLLEQLRPHLFQAYRNAELITHLREQAAFGDEFIEASGNGVALFDASHNVRFCCRKTRQWLKTYFDARDIEVRGHLPHRLRQWLRCQELPHSRGGKSPSPRQPLVVVRHDRQLVIRMAEAPSDGRRIVVFQERATTSALEPSRNLGLTAREAEVLSWVTQGKTSPDISVILGCRTATVNKHLEHIFEKLGVETRTAAALRATEALASG